MAQDQKQKIMIAVLAVLVLGAGSYYMFFRDSGNATAAVANQGPAGPRVRETQKKDETVTRKRAETRERETAQPTERREREESDDRETDGRRTRKTKETEVKKKKMTPAA